MKDGLTNTVLMIRPTNFGSNPDTIADNKFQNDMAEGSSSEISQKAIIEFDKMVNALTTEDVNVIVIQDTSTPVKPDAIFPNNWISSHSNSTLVTYPMMAATRRLERREDIVTKLTEEFGYKKRYSFEYHEEEDIYLEGTGSLVFDRLNKVVYACLSKRTNIKVLEKFSVLYNYDKVVFNASDRNGNPIYHTNVMMAIAKDHVVICLDSIRDIDERQSVVNKLNSSGKEIIEISYDQMEQFAGNMLQIKSKLGAPIMLMSGAAYDSLSSSQIDKLSSYSKIIKIPIPTIEHYGGGSVRCMVMEVFKPV